MVFVSHLIIPWKALSRPQFFFVISRNVVPVVDQWRNTYQVPLLSGRISDLISFRQTRRGRNTSFMRKSKDTCLDLVLAGSSEGVSVIILISNQFSLLLSSSAEQIYDKIDKTNCCLVITRHHGLGFKHHIAELLLRSLPELPRQLRELRNNQKSLKHIF